MYEFSWTSFFIGLIVLIVGTCLTIFHRQASDALGSGIATYERFKLAGLIGCGLGFIIMLNLHVLILKAILGPIFGM